jgi:cell division protein FtsB
VSKEHIVDVQSPAFVESAWRKKIEKLTAERDVLCEALNKIDAQCFQSEDGRGDNEHAIRKIARVTLAQVYIDDTNRDGRTCIPVLEDDASQVEEAVLALEQTE